MKTWAAGYLVTVVALLPLVASATSVCQLKDVSVSGVSTRHLRDYVYFDGTIINNCASAIGVQIKITVYGKDKRVLKVDDFWPASTNDIPPKSSFPFEWQVEDAQIPGMVSFDARVVSLESWTRIQENLDRQ